MQQPTSPPTAMAGLPAKTAEPETLPGPFQLASKRSRKVKLLLWGSWGVGKTTLALQFPAPVVFDLDGGADLYGNKFKFDVLRSADLVDIKNAIAFLLNGQGRQYQTLVIDPITVYWEVLQKFWSDIFLRRNRAYKAFKHEFYELGQKEWATIRQDLQTLFNKLLELDMHVVVTAREAVKYSESDHTKKDGVRFDCQKSLPYAFDTVLHLYRDERNKYMAQCSKDRSESLPGEPFEVNYKVLAKFFKLEK